MCASIKSLNHLSDLVRQFADMRGRTCLEVMRAVLATRTLANHGYTGGGRLSQIQCQAAIAILEVWIGRSTTQ